MTASWEPSQKAPDDEVDVASEKTSGFLAWIEARWYARLVLTLIIGLIGAYAASSIHMPLAWMLGPFLFCAAASLSGLKLKSVPHGREVAQSIVGLAIGLRFTASVLAATAILLPAMALTTMFVMVVTTIAAFLIMPIGRLDPKTAFFSTAAAGMADMATIAVQRGGDPNAVSVVHAIRVSMVVLSVPLLLFAFGEQGTSVHSHVHMREDVLSIVIAIGLAYIAARILNLTHFPNPWLIGGCVLGAILAGTDLLLVGLPRPLLLICQLVIGVSLGVRFERDLILKLPRVVGAALVITAYMIVATALGAMLLSWGTGLPYGTSFLSIAPAAVTEMVLTAQAMHLDAEIVTAFHVMRIALIEATILIVFAIFMRIQSWREGPI